VIVAQLALGRFGDARTAFPMVTLKNISIFSSNPSNNSPITGFALSSSNAEPKRTAARRDFSGGQARANHSKDFSMFDWTNQKC